MSRRSHFYRQPSTRGVTRERIAASVDAEVERKLQAIAGRWGVRKSWVQYKLLADALGVGSAPDYRKAGPKG